MYVVPFACARCLCGAFTSCQVAQQALLPGISDKSLFVVEVKTGKENTVSVPPPSPSFPSPPSLGTPFLSCVSRNPFETSRTQV